MRIELKVINNLDVDNTDHLIANKFDSKCPYWDIENFECIHTNVIFIMYYINNKYKINNNNNKLVNMDDVIIIVMFILY